MKLKIKLSLVFLFILQSFSVSAQQYYLYESDEGVYVFNRFSNSWSPVIHDATLLNRKSIIKTEGVFSVIQKGKNNVIDCEASLEGQSLEVLISKGHSRSNVSTSTGQKKGNYIIKDNTIGNNSVDTVNFHYLLVGCHNYIDPYWHSLPVPTFNVEKLSSAIENNMIPNNNYNLKTHIILRNESETTRKNIINSLSSLVDSIKPGNNNIILLYFSSHGEKNKEGKFNFVTYDTKYDSLNNEYINSIQADTLNYYISKMAAKQGTKVLVFVDACYSGTLIMDIRGMDGNCVYYMSTANDLIANDDFAKGSPFVRALIKCVSGEEQRFFRDDSHNNVTARNLQDYLLWCVKNEYKQQSPTTQRYGLGPENILWSIKSKNSIQLDTIVSKARRGDTDAMVEIGDIYNDTVKAAFYEVKPDSAIALKYYRYAYEWGNPLAACRLGMHYYYMSPTPDDKKAFQLFKESADKGCDLGLYYLSVCYAKGRGVEKDEKISKKYFSKIKIIESINDAYFVERILYPIEFSTIHTLYNGKELYFFPFHISGRWEKEDPQLFAGVQEIRAESGNPVSQAFVGDMYLYGKYEKNIDYEAALSWYEKAAKQGNRDGYYGLGMIYSKGLGLNKDYAKAAECFKKSADKRKPESYRNWGELLYEGGYGLQKDTCQAIALWKKGAELKDTICLYKYAVCLFNGVCLKRDMAKAHVFFKEAAKRGVIAAQFIVGYQLRFGLGIKQNSKEALKWLKKARDNGNVDANKVISSSYYADETIKEPKEIFNIENVIKM